MNCTCSTAAPPTNKPHQGEQSSENSATPSAEQQQGNAVDAEKEANASPPPPSPNKLANAEKNRETAQPTEPLSPTREQQAICLTACAPSNAHLSELDEEENFEELENGLHACDDDEGNGCVEVLGEQFPYSSGSSPVIHHSFRLAVRQSRAPSTCGKFNESLLGSLTTDPERVRSTLCVCTSIRHPRTTTTTSGQLEEEDGKGEGWWDQQQQLQLPTKQRPITDEYKISHEVISEGEGDPWAGTGRQNNANSCLLPPHRRQVIGIGESGKVMSCFHKRNGEKYALKVLRNSARSRREIELHWRSSCHPHVVSIVDMFENTFDELQCLLVVVEFMQGGDLLALFEANGRNPYPEKCVSRIVRQIGSAVQFLHERNVAHRDIKLENILCSSANIHQCTFKLADFGFAKHCDRPLDSPCCTPAYVCPEILGYKQYNESCDIWALGVATYILLCGYPPFYSMQGLPFSPGMRTRITAGLFAFPDEDWDCVSASTKHMISLMLKTEPAERISIQQLMSSEFLRLGTPQKSASKGPTVLATHSTLPPVPSDSSLSSDAGFESTDSKDPGSSNGSNSECQQREEGTHEPKSNEQTEQEAVANRGQSRPRAQFFVGSGYLPGFVAPKANSARQWNDANWNGANGMPNGRPELPQQRTYSIQEQVGQALALMRMAGKKADIGTLRDPSNGPTGSKLLERRRCGKATAGLQNVSGEMGSEMGEGV